MAPPDKNRSRLFATLYTRGANKGDWNACAYEAGYGQPPRKSSAILRKLIEEEAGHVPQELLEAAKGQVAIAPPVDLSDLELPEPDAGESDWKALGKKVFPIWRSIALGLADATSSQRQVLQDIINRAYGRVGQEKEEDTSGKANVLVLPTLATGAASRVCDVCRARLETPLPPAKS